MLVAVPVPVMRVRFPLQLYFLAMLSACSTWTTVTSTGSVYRGRCTHVGVRGAVANEGAAATLQVSTDWPGCSR